MKSISQVASLTGVSVRTLQYYDEIDEILKDPDFDRIAAFKKQKELFLLKRNRTDRLIRLLERLEKGESCMSFKEFDLSDYINALEDFKSSQTETVIEHWGSVENFDMFIQKIKDDEEHVAQLAIRQFGSIEKYTEAMKHNLEHFSEIMDDWYSQVPEEMRTEDKFLKLASHRGEDVSSDPVQDLVKEIIANVRRNAPSVLVGNEGSYCRMIIDCYSNDYLRRVFDTKHGEGSCDYIVRAFQYYVDSNSL